MMVVLDKRSIFGKKIGGLKHIYLSKGGRITLIKSTLSILPMYFFVSFYYLDGGG